MNQHASGRTSTRRILASTAVGVGFVTAAIVGTLLSQSTSFPASSFGDVLRSGHSIAVPGAGRPISNAGPPVTEAPRATSKAPTAARNGDGVITRADGVLPDGVTVFDIEYPGIANLDRALLNALREASTDAKYVGIELDINSGWRSPEYQNELLRAAISKYGSQKKAERWVATAETSPHVSGDAVDIGSARAIEWLSEHGAQYGLCQIYRNERWHYELRPTAIDRGCPRMYADPPHDPRMQQ